MFSKSNRKVAGALAAVLALMPAARAADAPAPGAAPDAIETFARLPTLRNPSLSPDGQYLALSVHNNQASWDQSDYQLVVFHLPDLQGVSRLNMARNYQPKDIVWVSNTRLAVSLAYTSGALDVPQATGEVVAVDFDGGHKQVLYSPRTRGTIDAGIHSMDMPRGAASIAGLPFPRNGHIYLNLSRGPDRGSSDWDASRSEVYDVDSSNGKAVLAGSIEKGSMSFVMHDGVARIASGPIDDRHSAVFARASADQPWQRIDLGTPDAQMQPLAISRDGQKLWSLFSADGGPEALVVSKPDGSDRQVLAHDDFASVGNVLWNPKVGEPFAVVYAVGRPHLEFLDQSRDSQLLKALNDKFADHLVISGGADEQDRHMLVVAQSDRDPGTVALLDTDTVSLRPLYQVEDWVHPEQMAERRPFRFTASDGMVLDGFLTLPHGSDGKHLPTVLLPHGGPIGPSDSWGYDPDSQFLASLGYAVVQVNYRGSGGRGPAFEHAGYRHFGDRIQQDILEGLQWSIAQGVTDADRVCVYGGSFGGYSSLMLPILAPKAFKCAIDYAGVADWSIGMRKSDTSHFRMGRAYFANAIGDEAAARAISPLYRLDQFNVPVLIAHGEDDPRVPYDNAKVLRAALDKAGKPYEWLSKPKEGHGFYTEADRADMYRHMRAFLARYLGS